MTYKAFSYIEYEKILISFKDKFCKFNIYMPEEFIILRHDVEFSIERALKMAEIEASHNVKSTFFFQVVSSAYNPFSVRNCEKIYRIIDLGHDVGLHFYVTHINENDNDNLRRNLERQKSLFEGGFSIDCDRFSFHRPPRWVLEKRSDTIDGLINAYGESFFEFSPNPSKIKYVADSQHKWSYGHPLEHVDKTKMQILVHPDEWTKSGEERDDKFFLGLVAEAKKEFVAVIDQETKHFRKHKRLFL